MGEELPGQQLNLLWVIAPELLTPIGLEGHRGLDGESPEPHQEKDQKGQAIGAMNVVALACYVPGQAIGQEAGAGAAVTGGPSVKDPCGIDSEATPGDANESFFGFPGCPYIEDILSLGIPVGTRRFGSERRAALPPKRNGQDREASDERVSGVGDGGEVYGGWCVEKGVAPGVPGGQPVAGDRSRSSSKHRVPAAQSGVVSDGECGVDGEIGRQGQPLPVPGNDVPTYARGGEMYATIARSRCSSWSFGRFAPDGVLPRDGSWRILPSRPTPP